MATKEEMLSLLMTRPQFVVIDIETTGFSPKKGAEILEIGACRYFPEKHAIKKRFHSFVKPKNVKKIPKKIVELTHIHDEEVADAPFIENVMMQLYEFIGDDVLVFHNAAFDWARFLSYSFEKIGKNVQNPVICSLMLSKWLLPLNGYKGTSFKLGDLCEYFGCQMVGAHRADVDAYYTSALLGQLRIIGRSVTGQTKLTIQVAQNGVEDFTNAKIIRITPWKKGQEDRLYVSTTVAQVYYDYLRKIWTVQKLISGKSLDMSKWEKFLQRELNVENLMEWLDNQRFGE